MVDEEQQQVRADLVSRLFALLTSKFEDGAALAAQCQGARPAEELASGAERLRDIAQEGSMVAEAIVELVRSSGAGAQ